MSGEVGDLIIKWSGQEYVISGLVETDTIADLKDAVFKKTNVLPERQKLLGLKIKGKLPDKEVQLSTLQIKPKTKIMMMGTREEELAKVTEPPAVMPDVINDFDIEEDEIAIENREEFLAKIEKRIKDYEIKILNEPREGKRLLVLDIDYTLFDHRSVAETPGELMRPYLHDFLKAAYSYYDIVIWSATGMKWIETKMNGLGVSSHKDYKICFYLDSDAMISVHTPKYGLIDVKPLGVVWGKFKQWSAANTIMFDDIRRNFIMNPQTGLWIRPFRKAHFNRDKDSELLKLMWYLEDITCETDFSVLNHKDWEKYKPKKKKSKKPSESEET